jgi:glycosyltransferase involved in cell wall biosynthesis
MAPRVGYVGIWNRPRDPGPWSGVPVRVMEALDEVGVFGGYLDATPWPPLLRAVRATLQAAGPLESAWMFRPAPRAVLGASNVVRRTLFSARADAWVVPAMGFGRPVRGRVASLCEISPAQLGQADLGAVRSFWPGITPGQIRALGRQQVRLHRAATTCCVASGWAGASLVDDHGIDPAKVHVVGYGVNVRVAPPADRDWSTPRFLFIGSGWMQKNLERVVRTFSRVRQVHPGATLDVVGNHPPLDEPGVTMHGRRPVLDGERRSLLESLYRRSTCLVVPSLHESFGIVYVEAATAGVPSIGTTVGGTTTSIGDGGVLVDPYDESALYRAMLRLSCPDEARRLGALAHRRSGLFTWRKVAERIVGALDLPGVDRSSLAPPLEPVAI